MSNQRVYPVMDIDPWPNGLGFKNAEDWWRYVERQSEEDKVDLLITAAHLSETIGQLLLSHDQSLFERFQLSPKTIAELCAVQAHCLSSFAAAWAENRTTLKALFDYDNKSGS